MEIILLYCFGFYQARLSLSWSSVCLLLFVCLPTVGGANSSEGRGEKRRFAQEHEREQHVFPLHADDAFDEEQRVQRNTYYGGRLTHDLIKSFSSQCQWVIRERVTDEFADQKKVNYVKTQGSVLNTFEKNSLSYRVCPLWWQFVGFRWKGHPRGTVVGGGWRGDKVFRVAGPGGWDGVDSCYWVSCMEKRTDSDTV